MTTTVYVGDLVEITVGPSSRVTRTYYYAGGLRVAMRAHDGEYAPLYYLHNDHLGSTSLATHGQTEPLQPRMYFPLVMHNAGGGSVPPPSDDPPPLVPSGPVYVSPPDAPEPGTVVVGSETRYAPYGEVRTDGAAVGGLTDFTYTGQQVDAQTGLMFYNARWYDPALGRFLSADTIVPDPGNPQDLNRYAYVRNNPVRYRDPSGHGRCVDEECNWMENPVTRWIFWRGSGRPSLPAGHYLYSREYGWFDTSHLNTGYPQRVIEDVRQVIDAGGGPVTIKQPLGRGPIEGTYMEHYQVSSEATPGNAVEIALGMYMHWSMGFELWESTVSVFGIRTAYAIEDLPSHYIGFYAKASGLSYAEAFANLGFVEGTDQEPPRITPWPPWNPSAWNWEVKNVFFTPRVQDGGGNWHNIPWPDAMTVTPVGSGSGLWEFRGAECRGNLCGITRP